MKLQDIIITFILGAVLIISGGVYLSNINSSYGVTTTDNNFNNLTEITNNFVSNTSQFQTIFTNLSDTSFTNPISGAFFILYEGISAGTTAVKNVIKIILAVPTVFGYLIMPITNTFGIDSNIISTLLTIFWVILIFILIGLFTKWIISD